MVETNSVNAWLIKIAEGIVLDRYTLSIPLTYPIYDEIDEGDTITIVLEEGSDHRIVRFARVFRIRHTLEETIFHFDGSVECNDRVSIDVAFASTSPIMARMPWEVYVNHLRSAASISPESFPVFDEEKDRAYIRELLRLAVVDDLLGPAEGPYEEIVGMSVRDRYLVGKLSPLKGVDSPIETAHEENVSAERKPYEGRHQPGEEFSSTEGTFDSDSDNAQDTEASKNQSLIPSSMGLTFCVDESLSSVEIDVSWGRYIRDKSERLDKNENPLRCWRRIPSGGKVRIELREGAVHPMVVDSEVPGVVVKGSVAKALENGDRLVTVFVVNTQEMPSQNQDEAWMFQPRITVRDTEGGAIFRRRPVLDVDGSDRERESLEMIYRNRVEFAVGHGTSVHWTIRDDVEHAVEIYTSTMPEYEVQVTETPGLNPDDRAAMKRLIEEGFLDMSVLAESDRERLVYGLKILVDDYATWIEEQEKRIGDDVRGYDEVATDAMDRCRNVHARLMAGIETLETNDDALEAFRFANRSMATQRVRSIYALAKRRGENATPETYDIAKNRSWRPFQLAFMLLSIPAIADPLHKDRTDSIESYADLLWFPTGGGKTEAYLGVAAFTMGIRRLQKNLGGYDSTRGLAVVMRYTLRLLTLQQFQRGTALICAMEVIRRSDPKKWGEEPFTIGLWVGQRVTPNTTEESHQAIQATRNGKRRNGSSPAQLTTCPWCGSEIAEGRDIEVRKDIGKTIVHCGDKLGRCEFSKSKSKDIGIPVVVVDEELYHRPPSMMIATVDKFAMMAWKGQVRTLFGITDRECPRHGLLSPESECNGTHQRTGALPAVGVKTISPIRPPDLIIQDEFHLISGPLGTMVGLYETAVDELATWNLNGKKVRPKVVASTATVRKANEQVKSVFLRNVSVFPPHGLDVEDNFFSVQRPIEEKPGRLYVGICSPGSSRPAVLIRLYVALLTAGQSLFDRFARLADPYMTVVGYFNSLRELGGMKRLSEDDVQTRSYRVRMSDVVRPGLAQRSIRNVDELTSRVSSSDIPKKLDQLEVAFKREWEKGETKAIDVVLATNMLSVGVDVNRLGVMAVNGQPKSTAEYIQATSRVGRSFPGIVFTVLTWSRPRDLSHYETFEHYHATFYKHVEAQSVTPFAPRALDRGLTGSMVSVLRLRESELNSNDGAEEIGNVDHTLIDGIVDGVVERAWKIKGKAAGEHTRSMLMARLDRWKNEAARGGRTLGYDKRSGQGDVVELLKKPGIQSWSEFTVPMSMREVEPGVKLVMDDTVSTNSPGWKPKKKKTEDVDNG